MKSLIPLVCSVFLAGCLTDGITSKSAEKSSGDTLLAPSTTAKEKPADVAKDMKAQAARMDVYQTDWNRTSAKTLKASEVDQLPQIIQMHSATYPPDMHFLNKQATVLVDFVVDADGTVLSATPVDLNAQPFSFSASAVVAVWSWKFKPALKDGKPVRVRMRVPIEFRLD